MKKVTAPKPAARKDNFTIRIPEDVRAALDKMAAAEDRSAGYVALRFILEGLKSEGFLK
jgi:predicted transcriptional regulator